MVKLTIQDMHRRSHGAEEKGRSTKSSALQQQVGFVQRNKRTKRVEAQLEGKSTFLAWSKTASSLIGSRGSKAYFKEKNGLKNISCREIKKKKRKAVRDE